MTLQNTSTYLLFTNVWYIIHTYSYFNINPVTTLKSHYDLFNLNVLMIGISYSYIILSAQTHSIHN